MQNILEMLAKVVVATQKLGRDTNRRVFGQWIQPVVKAKHWKGKIQKSKSVKRIRANRKRMAKESRRKNRR